MGLAANERLTRSATLLCVLAIVACVDTHKAGVGAACNSTDDCTAGTICSGGHCVALCMIDYDCGDGFLCAAGLCVTAESGACGDVSGCDDDNSCTDDACSAEGWCTHTNNAGACDDGDPCTSGDICAGGVCRGTPGACVEVCNGADDDGDGVADDGLFCLSLLLRLTDAVTNNTDPTYYSNTSAQVVYNPAGPEFGVAWTDYREVATFGDVTYFTRVSAAGAALGPDAYTDRLGGQTWGPQLVFRAASSHYATAADSNVASVGYRPIFALLDSAGARQLASPAVLDGGLFTANPVAMAGYNGGFAIVSTQRQPPSGGTEDRYNVMLSLLDSSGGVVQVGTPVTAIANPDGGSAWTGAWEPAIASDGDALAVTYKDGPDQGCGTPASSFYGSLMLELVQPSGTVTAGPTKLSDDACLSRVLWTGSEYAVVWYVLDHLSVNQLMFQRVSAAGVPLGSALPITSGPAPATSPSLVWTGQDYLVGFVRDRDQTVAGTGFELYLVTVDANATTVGPPTSVTPGAFKLTAGVVAGTGGVYLAAFTAVEDLDCGAVCKRDVFAQVFRYRPTAQ